MHTESCAHESFAHPPQASEPDLADLHRRSCNHVKTDIEHAIARIFLGDGRIDFCERVPLVLERGLQPLAARKDLGSYGRRA